MKIIECFDIEGTREEKRQELLQMATFSNCLNVWSIEIIECFNRNTSYSNLFNGVNAQGKCKCKKEFLPGSQCIPNMNITAANRTRRAFNPPIPSVDANNKKINK